MTDDKRDPAERWLGTLRWAEKVLGELRADMEADGPRRREKLAADRRAGACVLVGVAVATAALTWLAVWALG